MSATPKHSVSVAGVVTNGAGQVLAIQRHDNQHWEPPGGVLELDECFVEGVRREVFEETGLRVEVERLSGVYKNMSAGVVAFVFRCHAFSGNLATGSETARVEWLDRQVIPELMDEAYAVRIMDALADGVQVRTHDGVHVLTSLET